jgi:hypothetical protein
MKIVGFSDQNLVNDYNGKDISQAAQLGFGNNVTK